MVRSLVPSKLGWNFRIMENPRGGSFLNGGTPLVKPILRNGL